MLSTYIVVFSFWETMCRNGKTIPQKTIAVAILYYIFCYIMDFILTGASS